MSSLIGPIAPSPGALVCTFRRKSDNALVDVPNAEIRLRSPTGVETVLPATRLSVGTYQAGSLASPIVLDSGTWTAKGWSPVVGDLVYPDEVKLVVKGTAVSGGGSSLPATAAWNGNPFAPWTVTTTDATQTLLVRIPLAADQGVFFNGSLLATRLDGASNGPTSFRSGGGLWRRIGSAAPSFDTDAAGLYGFTGALASVWTNAVLSGISATCVVNTDSIDLMVTGKVGATIRWTVIPNSWTYL